MKSIIQKPLLGSLINWNNPLTKDLIGCWIMKEGSGNRVYDLSGNGNDGTINGGVWKADNLGTLVSLDTNTDDITLDKPMMFTPLMYGSSPWTLVIRAKFNANSGSDDVWRPFFYINSYTQPADYFALSFKAHTSWNDFQCAINDQWVETSASSLARIQTGTDFYATVICKWDGVNLSIEADLNDKAVTACSVANYPFTAATDIKLGYNYSKTTKIDFACLYKRAITDQEVLQYYREPFAMFEDEGLYLQPVVALAFVNVSDTITVAETVDEKVLNLFVPVTDTISVAETVDEKVLNLNVSIVEPTVVAETVTGEILINVSVTEPVTIAETVSRAASVKIISVADSVSVGEVIYPSPPVTATPNAIPNHVGCVDRNILLNKGWTVTINLPTWSVDVTDPATIAETVSRVASVKIISVADSITVAETVSRAASARIISVADSVSVAETVTEKILNLNIPETDTISVVETINIIKTDLDYTDVVDLISVVETIAATITSLNVTEVDFIAVAEASEVLFATLIVRPTESITATDGLTKVIINPLTIGLTETVVVAEGVVVEIHGGLYELIVGDSIVIVDNIARIVLNSLAIDVADAATINDVLSKIRLNPLILDLSDAINLSDVVILARFGTLVRASDTIALFETVNLETLAGNLVVLNLKAPLFMAWHGKSKLN